MSKLFFITNKTLRNLIIIQIILFVFSFNFFITISILIVAILFLFRKLRLSYSDMRSLDKSLLLSPVNGRVESIEFKNENTIIKTSSNLLRSFGVYFPISSEVMDVEISKVVLLDLSWIKVFYNRTTISFSTSSDNYIMILKPYFPYIYAKHWLETGDKGYVGSNLGFIPFGGSVTFVLSGNVESLVKKNDMLTACQTVLASME